MTECLRWRCPLHKDVLCGHGYDGCAMVGSPEMVHDMDLDRDRTEYFVGLPTVGEDSLFDDVLDHQRRANWLSVCALILGMFDNPVSTGASGGVDEE